MTRAGSDADAIAASRNLTRDFPLLEVEIVPRKESAGGGIDRNGHRSLFSQDVVDSQRCSVDADLPRCGRRRMVLTDTGISNSNRHGFGTLAGLEIYGIDLALTCDRRCYYVLAVKAFKRIFAASIRSSRSRSGPGF